AVLNIEGKWCHPSTPPSERCQLLIDCLGVGLKEVGLPGPDFKEDAKMSPTECGLFNGNTWTINVNPSFFAAGGPAEAQHLQLRECLDTLYHELGHYEQHVRTHYYFLRKVPQAAELLAMNRKIQTGSKPISQELIDYFNLRPAQATLI